ncbi:hypothetical protein [Bradyrhizobium sp. 150]|uniref:hypothetical protein n=1 Tax=Bradyrhizobium sp. 150 TaxID=2782625 RepID=UPI001FF7397F|nr:hypothetical protein [Bradyrhizobium sp. 150]MCK1671989.1 hypothetical protein [Bradyrhizobium sp. 150]
MLTREDFETDLDRQKMHQLDASQTSRRGEFTGRRDGHLPVFRLQQAVLGEAQARSKLGRRKETAPARGAS